MLATNPTVVTLHLGDRFPLTVHLSDDGTAISVELLALPGPGPGGCPDDPSFSFTLNPTAPSLSNGHPHNLASGRFSWSLTRGLSVRHDKTNAFARALAFAYGTMYRRDTGGYVPTPSERLVARATMRDLYAQLRALAVLCADRCDPAARKLALRFGVHLRFEVYRHIVNDSTGRIGQLAASTPGALIFALALLDGAHGVLERAGRRLLDAVVAGARLDRALDDAIVAWDAGTRQQRQIHYEPGDPTDAFERLFSATPTERRRLHDAQRLLIRRAGSHVASTSLFLPPPLDFAPEDIPRTPLANARWYRVMKSGRATLLENAGAPGRGFPLSRYLSRHALALYQLAGRRRLRQTLFNLLDYVIASGRVPSRMTDPARLLTESSEWHERIGVVQNVAELAALVARDASQPALANLVLPPPPFPAWSDADAEVAVRPVDSVAALVAEGLRMRHCVASYAPRVAAGSSAIYSITVADKPLTAELRRDFAGAWQLGQLYGQKNRRPTQRERSALRPWLATVAAFAPPGDPLQAPIPC
ncbi:MAG: hypothetical protein EXR73_10345 [Myxococcales bacterium]|nr:hypothetical protein [Myxococcales bacterium]